MNSLFDYGLMFFSSYILVMLFGIQSKNVQQSHYFAAFFVSIGISVANFIFVKYAATGSYDVLFATCSGGAFGIITAIYIHDKVTERARKNKASKNQA